MQSNGSGRKEVRNFGSRSFVCGAAVSSRRNFGSRLSLWRLREASRPRRRWLGWRATDLTGGTFEPPISVLIACLLDLLEDNGSQALHSIHQPLAFFIFFIYLTHLVLSDQPRDLQELHPTTSEESRLVGFRHFSPKPWSCTKRVRTAVLTIH